MQKKEQYLISKSVTIKLEEGRAEASLPFKANPENLLVSNRETAIKRLGMSC